MNDLEVEARLDYLGLNENRVTLRQIQSKVKEELYYNFPGTTTTVCCLILENGYSVIGSSSCTNMENFQEDLGKSISKENAINKIWELEGYLLKEKLNTKN